MKTRSTTDAKRDEAIMAFVSWLDRVREGKGALTIGNARRELAEAVRQATTQGRMRPAMA